MGQQTIGHYLVILILLALVLVALARAKRDAFRKLAILLVLVSAGPLSFEAVVLAIDHFTASQSLSDGGTVSTQTDVSVPTSEKPLRVMVDQPPPVEAIRRHRSNSSCSFIDCLMGPVEAVQPHPSNPNGQYAAHAAPGCLLPGDVVKFNNLIAADRYDLASKLDCVIIPEGTEVIHLDTIGDLAQVIWEKNGKTVELWSSAYHFKYNFTRHLN